LLESALYQKRGTCGGAEARRGWLRTTIPGRPWWEASRGEYERREKP